MEPPLLPLQTSKEEKEQIEDAISIIKKDFFTFVLFVLSGTFFLLLNLKFCFIPDLTLNFQFAMLAFSLPFSIFIIYMMRKKNQQFACIYNCDLEENQIKEKIISLFFTNEAGKTRKASLNIQHTKNIQLLKFISKSKGELEVTYGFGIIRYRVFGKIVMKKLADILEENKNSL